MKKGLILVLALAAMLFISQLGPSATYEILRGGGTAGSVLWCPVDSADTIIGDTFWSDAFELDTAYGHMNFMIYFSDFDIGGEQGQDTVNDLVIAYTISRFGNIGVYETLFVDSFTDIPGAIWHKVITDTMVANQLLFHTRIVDTVDLPLLTPSIDSNGYKLDIHMLAGGSR